MVRLKNIKKSSSVIECDFIPEDSLQSGHIVVDIISDEIKECVYPDGYEWCKNHVIHAKNKLIELSTKDSIPDEKLVMWH